MNARTPRHLSLTLVILALAPGCLREEEPHRERVLKATTRRAPEVTIGTDDRSTLDEVSPMALATAPVADLDCTSCHTAFGTFPTVHPALLQEGGCLNCHRSLGNDHPIKGEREFELAGHGEDLCGTCHQAMVSDLKADRFVHAPIRDEGCVACHDPHVSESARLLKGTLTARIKLNEYQHESMGLCFRCHERSLAEVERTTQATAFRNGDANLHYRHVVREGRTCRSCHEIHSGNQAHLVRESLPFGNSGYQMKIEYQPRDDGGTCLKSCHQERSYAR